MFRLSIRSMVELSVALVLGLSGFGMLVGTVDEFKAGRAFDRAMDNYVARHLQPTYDYLYEAIQAKADYDAPLEALGKLHIDDGRKAPEKLKEAM
ncbi:hypothetical protein HQ560_07405, partial [bacterium]|nr:hypothetical protein [bacterium]